MTQFKRGEGLFFEYPFAFITTTSDSRIHAYNVDHRDDGGPLGRRRIEGPSPAFDVDQLTHSQGGEIFVCEDQGLLRISILSADGRVIAPFLQLDGSQHAPAPEFGNETTGVVFDPSGTRMYFSAQRSYGFGALYEITGPFRRDKTDLREPTLRVEAPETRDVPPAAQARDRRSSWSRTSRARSRRRCACPGERPRTDRAQAREGRGRRSGRRCG